MTFASVILAIALSEILGGWGKLIRSNLPIPWSPLWIGWSLFLVALIIIYWSGMWPDRDQSFSEGHKIFWLAIPTFFLVVLSYLLSPEPDDGCESVDLEERYWRISSRMFPLLTLFMASSLAADVVIVGEALTPAPAGWLGGIAGFSAIIAAGLVKKPWLHWLVLAIVSSLPLRYLLSTIPIFG
jgi:hypothetical protein